MRIRRFLWVSSAVLASILPACGDDESPSQAPDGMGGSGGEGSKASGGSSSTGGKGTGGGGPAGGGPGTGGSVGTGGFVPAGGTAGTGGVLVTGGSFNGCDETGRCPTPPMPDPPGTALCGGVACPAGQECCLMTLQCFDPNGSRASCLRPQITDPEGRRSCGSNSDCGTGEYCNVEPNGLCAGPGFCESREMCPWDDVPTEYCGCDGRTYTSRQHACSIGVRAPNAGACGVQTVIGRGGGGAGLPIVPCNSDDDCAEACCEITGTCHKTADAAICTLPPPGTSRPCLSNLDCFRGTEYCDGASCTGPGGCVPLGACTDAIAPVCGCDGHTYENAGCAAAEGMRIAACGDGGT